MDHASDPAMTRVGIYVRISRKHPDREEDSIRGQREICRQYLRGQTGWYEADMYEDDGYSGMDFHRPGVTRLYRDICRRKLDVLLVKDLSRLGRNHLEVGRWIDCFLPAHEVRLVCAGAGECRMEEMGVEYGIRNVMNEWYARDIGRKVHMVKQWKKERGEFLGSRAPYGYRVVVREGRRTLQEDPPLQEVCREIRRMRMQSMTWDEIRRALYQRHIHPPGEYERTKCIQGEPCGYWNETTLRAVIKRTPEGMTTRDRTT